MSRMLRGQATLQSIIGKSTITKRPGNVQRNAKSKARDVVEAAIPASDVTEPIALPKETRESDPQEPSESLPDGFVRCPVCGTAFEGEDAQMNLHLDKCLAKRATKGRRSQSTLSQFASAKDSHVRKRARIAESNSCPELSRSSSSLDVQLPETHTSPGRQSADASKPMSPSAIRTRSGKLLSPPRTTARQPEIQSPFEPSSQETPFEALPGGETGNKKRIQPESTKDQNERPKKAQDQGGRAPLPGEGERAPFFPGEQSLYPSAAQLTNQQLQPDEEKGDSNGVPALGSLCSHPGGVRFQTHAVGRRFNSSGIAQVGQTAKVQHENENPRDKNALLLVAEAPGGVLGYLPRAISHYLAAAQKKGELGSFARVVKLGTNINAAITVDLEVWPECGEEAEETEASFITERLSKARAAAENSASLQRSGSGTGEILRSNFLLLLDAVMEQDSHLFSEEEICVFNTYRAVALFQERPLITSLCFNSQGMSDVAQMLFLRLFLRAGPWFKLNSLAYSECPDIPATAAEIEAAGLALSLKNAAQSDRLAAVRCLTVLEVQSLLAALDLLPQKRGKGSNKKELVSLLHRGLNSPSKGEEVFTAMSNMAGPCVRLAESAQTALLRAQRLFFLNESQTLSNFLVLDLGILLYPEYTICRTQPVFKDRLALLAYETALEHAAKLDDALEMSINLARTVIGCLYTMHQHRMEIQQPQLRLIQINDIRAGSMEGAVEALKPAFAAIDAGRHKLEGNPKFNFLLRFSAAWVYASMATIGVSILEKQKQYSHACELLRKLLGGQCCPARRGEWWSRLTINLSTHLKRDQEALETAETALADEWVKHGDRLDLQRRLLRLAQPPRRWKTYTWAAAAKREPREVRIEARPLPSTTSLRSRFTHPSGEGECNVEQLALLWYAEETHGSWQGIHAEGGIWATLFGLLMWEVLFAPIPDSFRNQFQTAPLDLPTPAFFPARQDVIQACLERIRAGQAPKMIASRWESSYKTMCAGVNWERNDVEELSTIAECIGGSGLAAVCCLLAEDRSGWQGGMPDLLLWNPEACSAKLSEVKGPRDHLSMQQRAWLNALSGAGLDVEVLKVVEPGTAKKSQRRKSRR